MYTHVDSPACRMPAVRRARCVFCDVTYREGRVCICKCIRVALPVRCRRGVCEMSDREGVCILYIGYREGVCILGIGDREGRVHRWRVAGRRS